MYCLSDVYIPQSNKILNEYNIKPVFNPALLNPLLFMSNYTSESSIV